MPIVYEKTEIKTTKDEMNRKSKRRAAEKLGNYTTSDKA